LKILHVTEYCHHESIGGTERYILDLIRELDAMKHQSAIGWLTQKTDEKMMSLGIRIFPLPGTVMRVDPPNPDLLPALEKMISDFRPDVIHFHTFGRNEARIAQWAHSVGILYMFTYHSPGWTCRREDLLAFGRSIPCNGEVKVFRCSACKLQERAPQLPVWMAWVAAFASILFSIVLSGIKQNGFRRRTAFLADTFMFRRDLRRFLKNADVVIACAEWSVSLLIRNGAIQSHLHLIPQGVSHSAVGTETKPMKIRAPLDTFVIGYVGRVVSVKGVDIVVRAFRKFDAPNAKLHIYGWPEYPDGNAFIQSIQAAARDDSRIRLIPRLSMKDMEREYSNIDLLCIPSVSLETGPLVLFEALQHGVPVLGSKRIGQIGLLRDRGGIVEPNTPEQWHFALQKAFEAFSNGQWHNERIHAYNSGKIRSMAVVASETLHEYERVYEKSGG
jgi:glycosyltransferase involved in cell wall biosynthesis